jgi:hypothetical protein
MASITFTEIKKLLMAQHPSDGGSLVEIRFDDAARKISLVDEELKNKVITADCPYGSVVILFDEYGLLRAIEVT